MNVLRFKRFQKDKLRLQPLPQTKHTYEKERVRTNFDEKLSGTGKVRKEYATDFFTRIKFLI